MVQYVCSLAQGLIAFEESRRQMYEKSSDGIIAAAITSVTELSSLLSRHEELIAHRIQLETNLPAGNSLVICISWL